MGVYGRTERDMERDVAFDVGRLEGADETEDRKRPIDEEGARGVEGAGSVNENIWTVEAV